MEGLSEWFGTGNKAGEKLFAGLPTQAYGRLQVLDVSDLEHPKTVAWYEPEYGGVHNVWVAGDTLYLAAGTKEQSMTSPHYELTAYRLR